MGILTKEQIREIIREKNLVTADAVQMPGGKFNSDINDAISGKASYTVTDTRLVINGNPYPLPSRWADRLEAYEKAQEIW